MSNGVILLKSPYISLTIAPRGWECETTCRNSWPGNLFQVLNLTFDSCFKVKLVHHSKRPYISLIIGSTASECKNSPLEGLAFKCFACKQFWPHFEKQIGRHSKLFKIIKILKLEILQIG